MEELIVKSARDERLKKRSRFVQNMCNYADYIESTPDPKLKLLIFSAFLDYAYEKLPHLVELNTALSRYPVAGKAAPVVTKNFETKQLPPVLGQDGRHCSIYPATSYKSTDLKGNH